MILKAALIYLRTLHPVLVRTVWKDFLRGFVETGNESLAIEPFAENSYVGKYRLINPGQWTPLNVLSSTFLPETGGWLDRSRVDLYVKGRSIKGLGKPHISLMLFMTLLFIGLCFWTRRGVCSRAIPALAILLTGTGVFGATMACVYFMPRYALPLWIAVLIALSLAVEGLFENGSRCRVTESPFETMMR